MKNLFLLFGMAVLLCAGMAVLCTACTEKSSLSADAVLSGAEASSAQETASTQPATAVPETKNDPENLGEPDLRGVIQDVGRDSFTILPIHVQSAGNTAMAAAGTPSQEIQTVAFEGAVIETVRVYNGGHEEAESASAGALISGRQVYLYGQTTETGFAAERILVLLIEADAS